MKSEIIDYHKNIVYIKNGDQSQLKNYIFEQKKELKFWIKKIKEIQSLTPKSTILQGSGFKDFYEVLTRKSPEKISRFFILSPKSEIITDFVKKNKF